MLQFQMQRLVTNLYSIPSIPRKFVQIVVNELENIITVPVEILQDKVKKVLQQNLVPVEEKNNINLMFHTFSSVITQFGTEHLRFKNLREAGLFIEPISKKNWRRF